MYYDLLLEWLGVPAEPQYLLYRPWTLLTYMFTHFSFLHLLFNMLWLYWFGNFFLTVFSERQLTAAHHYNRDINFPVTGLLRTNFYV